MTAKVAFFSTQEYDRKYFDQSVANRPIEIEYLEAPLNAKTAKLAAGCEAVCLFVNDDARSDVVETLHSIGVRLVALRCAGFNNVDMQACEKLGLSVVRVPEYSPYSVAEHTFGLILALYR